MSREAALVIVSGFGYLTLAAQILVGILLILLLARTLAKKNKSASSAVRFFSDNALPFAFLVSLTAMAGSLFFSEITHFVPCKLCWYQRIAMYPQVLLLGIASVKNDFAIRKYVLPLSFIGAAVAIYHYLLQMSPLPLPCSDEVANCALKQFAYFGYITIPLMSLTAFILIIIFMVIVKNKEVNILTIE